MENLEIMDKANPTTEPVEIEEVEIEKPKTVSGVPKSRQGRAGAVRKIRARKGSLRVDSGAPGRRLSVFEKASAELMNAKTNRAPVTVTVAGIAPIKFDAASAPTNHPVAFYPNVEGKTIGDTRQWMIFIPKSEFCELGALTAEERNNERLLDARCAGYIGAEIDIIPITFIAEQNIVIASRTAALEKKRRDFWFGREVRRNGEESDLIKEGDRVEARIVAVNRASVTVEIFGAETQIGIEEVSYQRLQNCRGVYKPGDRTYVRIKSVRRDTGSGAVRFTASIKEAYRDPRDAAMERYIIGGKYKGVVSMLNHDPGKTEQSGAFVRLLGGVDAYCHYPKVGKIDIGSEVTLYISGKDPDTKKMWGNIIHVENQDDL